LKEGGPGFILTVNEREGARTESKEKEEGGSLDFGGKRRDFP